MEIGTQTANQIDSADVDRLDAVDDPASGRRWLITKFADDTENREPQMNAQHLEKSSLALIEAVKSESNDGALQIGQKSVDALNEVVKSLGIEAAFKMAEAKSADAVADAAAAGAADAAAAKAIAEKKEHGEGGAAVGEPPKKDDDEDKLEAVKSSIATLVESMKSMQDQVTSLAAKSEGSEAKPGEAQSAGAVAPATPAADPATPPASTQSQGTEHVQKRAPKKMGEGLFTDLFQR